MVAEHRSGCRGLLEPRRQRPRLQLLALDNKDRWIATVDFANIRWFRSID